MFRLLRYFSLTSAVVLSVTAVVLVTLYRSDQMREHATLAQEENERLATSFANTFLRQFAPFLMGSGKGGISGAKGRGELRAIDIAFNTLTSGLPILKVRILSADGVILYSLNRDEIGTRELHHPTKAEALQNGRQISDVEFHKVFETPVGLMSERWVVESYTPFRDAVGQLGGWLELYADITPAMNRLNDTTLRLSLTIIALFAGVYGALFLIVRRADRIIGQQRHELDESHAELRESEIRFRTVTQTAADAIVSVDGGGRIISWNHGAERIFGHTETEVVGQDAAILMPEIYRARHTEGMRMAVKNGLEGVGATRNHQGLRKSGDTFPLELTLSRWEMDGAPYFTAIMRDATERVEAEIALARRTRELERSNADLEQFAYVASHDLQEPLRTVTSYMQLLQKRFSGKISEEADEYINFAAEGAKRMHRLISDLLVYSRVTTHGREFVPVDLSQALDSALANLDIAITDKSARIEAAPLPQVMGDGTQLISLFQNLIGNAIKYQQADAEPHITVRCSMNGDGEWEIAIADNGIGIAPEHAERIFVIFQRLHLRSEYDGTGIGLAVAKKIVQRHKGRIWVESEEGEGSTFRFTLPVLASGA